MHPARPGHIVLSIVVLTTLCCYLSIAQSHDPPKTEYEMLLDSLFEMNADPARVAHVSNVVLRRDVGEFKFLEGEIYFCKRITGRVCAAYFSGKGVFTFVPPTKIEKEQLRRFFEKDSLSEPFSELFLLFGDTTETELERYGEFRGGDIPDGVNRQIGKCVEFCTNREKSAFDYDVISYLLNRLKTDSFYAHIGVKGSRPLFFGIDPFSEEEVYLLKRDPHVLISHTRELISLFNPASIRPEENPKRVNRLAGFTPERYVMHCAITKHTWKTDLGFAVAATVAFRFTAPGVRWLWFDLHEDFRVDSAFWEDGHPATFSKGKKSDQLWIACNATPKEGEVRSITLYYHDDYLEHFGTGMFRLKGSTEWYPQHYPMSKARFDVTFENPSDMTLACVGERTTTATDHDVTTTRWVTNTPIRNESFNLGYFRGLDVTRDSLPPITVLMTDNMLHGRGGNQKDVGTDIANSIAVFTNLFGRCPLQKFYATEIPEGHGEAFPGLIHLSQITFSGVLKAGYDEVFRAHEVAHQWWGIGVEPRTYHDSWLSEGFAQYSAVLYLRTLTPNNENLFTMLESWKKDILNNRQYLFGHGQEAGPISLGYRTESAETEGDYNLIIYEKGAWILHMLRNMTLDLKTMKEDVFKSILLDFYSTYHDSTATTDDFRRIVEKHAAMDLKWFFNEWVDGSQIPLYKFAYKVEPSADSTFKIRCRIKQQNVPSGFQMYVPIKVDLGDGRSAIVRRLVRGAESEFSLPLIIKSEPKGVILNDMESVLCEVDTERW